MALVQLLKKLKKKGHYLYKSWQKKEIEYRLYLSVQNIRILDYRVLSRYVTTKNKKNTPDRMELKKYNPIMRKYTIHKEIK